VTAAVAVGYALVSGLRTIVEFDMGWQMATARWIVQHHQIPSVDVLSYTISGQPWIYPIGAGLIFYGTFLVGGYALISWLAAMGSAAITALVLRRGSVITAALAILAVPLIATRTTARAELFTVILFAAMLSLVWQQYESGTAKLWLLPLMMVAWVNLHPGFVIGLGVLGAYVGLELLDMLWPEQRAAARGRLERAWPWLLATVVSTLLNPWGWKAFEVIARQEAAMGAHSQLILEWAPIPLTWRRLELGLNPRDLDEFYVLLVVIVLLVIPLALVQRKVGAAIFVAAATYFPLRHMRFTALFAVVVVIVGGGVLASFFDKFRPAFVTPRLRAVAAMTMVLPLSWLASTRSRGMWTDNAYLSGTNLVTFGSGLSWWFPDRAADFIERERLPGQIFSTGSEGGFVAFRLGPKYPNYIDGRAVPFGTDMMLRSSRLEGTPPEAADWKQEAERYDINVILVPIGRYVALQFFPVLKQFCESDVWRPVYLDEVSVVFLRRRPETEGLIQRLQINCATAPLPAGHEATTRTEAFNQWGNAASVLRALGRDDEAFHAANRALEIFPNSGYLHFLRGHMYRQAGDLSRAEQDYLEATRLEPTLVAPWSALAAFYQDGGRLPEAIDAWKHAAGVSRWPWEPLVSLGYANLQAQRPREALAAFDAAADSLPAHHDLMLDNSFLANIAHGRARSWYYLGDLTRAIFFEEEAARLLPDVGVWSQLADLYDRAGRTGDANRVRAQAVDLAKTR
jgi:tetratricopeptide (TPR) repeat protein